VPIPRGLARATLSGVERAEPMGGMVQTQGPPPAPVLRPSSKRRPVIPRTAAPSPGPAEAT
jgi:hypothetical protein